jgi:Flp pilus assembly protein TadD
MLLHLEGRFDDEVRIYREVLSRQPENPVILNNLAWSLSEGLNHPSEAMMYVEQYMKRPGRLAESLDTRGRILIRLGRTDDAIKDLEEVVRVEPTGAHLFHLAYAYHKAGRDEDYRKTIERVRKSGLTVAGVDSTERAEFEALVGP